jgi:hypothetical protein
VTAPTRYLLTLPGPVLGGPPLILAVALGLMAHRIRNRRTHR